MEKVTAIPDTRHVILVCPAVNALDMSAIERLEAITGRLKDMGIVLHLTEERAVHGSLEALRFHRTCDWGDFLSQPEAIHKLGVPHR